METIKTIKTPRGNLNIKAIFSSKEKARSEGYGYYFTNDGIDIFSKHIGECTFYFATVESIKQELEKFYDENNYDVEVIEEVAFGDFIVLRCKEWHPCSPTWTHFDIIAKDGKFYNSNFDDIVEIHEESNRVEGKA